MSAAALGAILLQPYAIGSVGGIFARGNHILLAVFAHQLDDRALIFFGYFRFDCHSREIILSGPVKSQVQPVSRDQKWKLKP